MSVIISGKQSVIYSNQVNITKRNSQLKSGRGPARWLSWSRCLLPRLTNLIQPLELNHMVGGKNKLLQKWQELVTFSLVLEYSPFLSAWFGGSVKDASIDPGPCFWRVQFWPCSKIIIFVKLSPVSVLLSVFCGGLLISFSVYSRIFLFKVVIFNFW